MSIVKNNSNIMTFVHALLKTCIFNVIATIEQDDHYQTCAARSTLIFEVNMFEFQLWQNC